MRREKFFCFGNGSVFRTGNHECIGAVWVRGRSFALSVLIRVYPEPIFAPRNFWPPIHTDFHGYTLSSCDVSPAVYNAFSLSKSYARFHGGLSWQTCSLGRDPLNEVAPGAGLPTTSVIHPALGSGPKFPTYNRRIKKAYPPELLKWTS